MPSTYTQNLGLEMPADGEQAGTWGDTVNNNYEDIDTATDGSLSIALSASSYSLVTQNGAPSEGRNKLIIWTGALAQQATVNIQPATAQKLYTMVNQTTGGFSIAFQQGTGGTFVLQPGYGCQIFTDGAGAGAFCGPANYNPQLGNVLVTGTLTVQGSVTYSQPQSFARLVTFTDGVQVTGGATVDSLTLTTGTPNPYDIYYRSAAGSIVPLPIGAVGQTLIVTSGPALAWGTAQATIGSIIGGSIPNAIYFANASNQLSQGPNIFAVAGTGIGLGLLPACALHLGHGLAPAISLDSNNAASQGRVISFMTNSVARWNLYTPGAAESGSNAGSDIIFAGYNDAATTAQTLWCGIRASGDMTVGYYGDLNAQLGVVNQNASHPALVVRGAANQSAVLQQWQNSAGAVVASIDNSGNLVVGGGGFLQLDVNGRLDLHGTVSGHPWGTIHVGPEGGPFNDLRGSIAFETAQGNGILPPGVCRMYYRSGPGTPAFVIQFYYNGTQYFAYLYLVGQVNPNVSWGITTTQI